MPTFNQWKEDFRNLLLVPSITSLVDERIFYGSLASLQTNTSVVNRQGGPEASFNFPFPAITIRIQEGPESGYIHQFYPVIVGVHSNLHSDEAQNIMGAVFDILKNAQPDRKKFTVRADQTVFDSYDVDSRLYNVFKQFRVNRIGIQS